MDDRSFPADVPATADASAGAQVIHPQTSAPVLSVRGLTTELHVERMGALRQVCVVDDVSFDIGRGETLGLVGESGSGKTLTALSIVGLLPSVARLAGGTVRFEGRDLARLPERQLRAIRGARIGFVVQEPMSALNPVFTVGDQIAEVVRVHAKTSRAAARARAVALLDAVRIPHAARRAGDYPHQLSGGQRQRVVLAAALACGPSLLIADEPTTALDVTVQAEILDLLRAMREQFHLSVLLISHDLGVVSQLADRVAILYAGQIVETGSVADVLGAPRHPYTQGLIDSLPGGTPGTRLRAIPGAPPDLSALPTGCPFGPRCGARIARCDSARPALVAVAPDRAVRCVHHDEVAS